MNLSSSAVEEVDVRDRNLLLWIVAPFIIVLGMVGNTLAFISIRRLQHHFRAFSYYFQSMMVSDSTLLLYNLLPRWLESLTNLRIRSDLDMFCLLEGWIYYWAFLSSSWFLTAMIFTRTLGSIKPHLVRERQFFFKLSIAIIVSLSCMLSFVMCFGHHEDLPDCFLGSQQRLRKTESDSTWSWIAFTLVFFLPFLIIIGSNTCLVVAVTKSKSRIRKHTTQRRHSTRLHSHSHRKSSVLTDGDHVQRSRSASVSPSVAEKLEPNSRARRGSHRHLRTVHPDPNTDQGSPDTDQARHHTVPAHDPEHPHQLGANTNNVNGQHVASQRGSLEPLPDPHTSSDTTKLPVYSRFSRRLSSTVTFVQPPVGLPTSRWQHRLSLASRRWSLSMSTVFSMDGVARKIRLSQANVNRLVSQNSVLLLLVASSFIYCVLIMPKWLLDALTASHLIAKESVSPAAHEACELLEFTNAGIKFYLYVVTGSKFRKEISKVAQACRKGKCLARKTKDRDRQDSSMGASIVKRIHRTASIAMSEQSANRHSIFKELLTRQVLESQKELLTQRESESKKELLTLRESESPEGSSSTDLHPRMSRTMLWVKKSLTRLPIPTFLTSSSETSQKRKKLTRHVSMNEDPSEPCTSTATSTQPRRSLLKTSSVCKD